VALVQIQIGRRRRESHVAFQHDNATGAIVHFRSQAGTDPQADLRVRHGEDERVAAIRLTGEIDNAVVER
jgi:hypothetical protein